MAGQGAVGWGIAAWRSAKRAVRRGMVPLNAEEWLGEEVVTLASFTSKESIHDNWDIFCDQDLGGKSTATFGLSEEGNTAIFSGVLCSSTDQTTMKSSGYASIMHKEEDWSLFEEYDAIGFRVKTDGRVYLANLKSADLSPDHMYQCVWTAEKDKWTDVELPLSGFIPTYQGVLVRDIMPLNRLMISSFGFLLADKRDGPFALEVDSVVAINRNLRQRKYGRFKGSKSELYEIPDPFHG